MDATNPSGSPNETSPMLLERYRVKPGDTEAATAAARALAEKVGRLEPGALRYEVLVEEDGHSFVHIMRFASKSAEEVHEGAEHVREYLATLQPLYEAEPTFTALTQVAAMEAKEGRLRTVHHVEELPAPPQAVYDALMDERQHAAFTGMVALIDAKVGGRFSTCGRYNTGWTLALSPGRRIVQAWRHGDWPDGHFSIADFVLEPSALGTRLTFTQTGVPSEAFAWIDQGWRDFYWTALKDYLLNPLPASEPASAPARIAAKPAAARKATAKKSRPAKKKPVKKAPSKKTKQAPKAPKRRKPKHH